MSRSKTPTGANKQNIQAWSSFNLGVKPFKIEDIFREPTKEELDYSVFEYVPFSTYDFCRLDKLQAICNNSPTTSGIVQQKVNYFCGDGFYAVPASSMSMLASLRMQKRELEEIEQQQLESLNDFLTEVTPEGENIEEVFQKLSTDFFSFGNAFCEIQRIKVRGVKKYYIRPLPITWCRPKKANSTEMYPTHIGVCSDFEDNYDLTPPKSIVKELPIFPNFEVIDGVEKSIVHLKKYEPTLVYWGVPDWTSAKIWAEIEYRIQKFNQSKFENGFTPSAIISLFGSANPEEARTVVNAMKDCFTGTGNNSKMFIQALRDPTYKSDIQVLDSSSEGEFMSLQKLAQESIISAHRWSVSLTGLRTSGSLGSNQQIRSEFDIVYSTVIRPVQRLFLTKFLNPVIQDAGEFLGQNWTNIALDISKPMPVSFAGDIPVEQVLNRNEMRAELGLEPEELTEQPQNTQQNENID